MGSQAPLEPAKAGNKRTEADFLKDVQALREQAKTLVQTSNDPTTQRWAQAVLNAQ
jgi:hypothetical protein